MSGGLYRRKVLNNLEQPQWPDIKKGPPRFVKSKRHSPVDVGRTVMDADKYPETWGYQVLTNSKDITQKYGRRPHHTLVVDREFRPPPLGLEDTMPISRGRRPTVFGRINPGGGYFKAQNISANEVDGYLKEDERVSIGSLAPTYESPITFFEPSRQPVLARTLPSGGAVSAGRRAAQGKEVINVPSKVTITDKMVPIPVSAGFEYPFGAGGPFEVADVALERKHPALSIDAGSGTLQVFTPRELPIYEYTLPHVSERERARESAIALGFEIQERELRQTGTKRVKTDAGFESSYRSPIQADTLGLAVDRQTRSKPGRSGRVSAGRGPSARTGYEETLPTRGYRVRDPNRVKDVGFYQIPEASSSSGGQRTPTHGDVGISHKKKVGAELSRGSELVSSSARPQSGFSFEQGLSRAENFHYKPEALW